MKFLQCLLYFCAVYIMVDAQIGEETVLTEITNGKLLGIKFKTVFNETCYAFQGIPYAQPPTGQLRFSAPRPAQNWTGIYNATSEGSVCPQLVSNTTVTGSENCLFLNVYTPQLPSNESEHPQLPCIIYIHGGTFISNSGNIGLHGADRFLFANVILVTINYRLGALGFLSTDDDVIPGNWGIKDQVQALRWVRDNIAVFGGDPGNVTIMGESAGAASVHYLIQSSLAKGLFHKAISESGSTLSPWSIAANAKILAYNIGLLNGIVTTSSKTLLEKLRRVGYVQLCKSSAASSLGVLLQPLDGLPYAPIAEVTSPEAAVTGYSYERLQNGEFNRVPLLHGFNSLEAREASTLPWFPTNLLLQEYNIFPSLLAPTDMHASEEGDQAAGKEIKDFYFDNKSVKLDDNLIVFVSDGQFVRGIRKTAQLMSQYVPVYLYEFSFTGGSEHNYFNPEGVSHAEELQFLFLSNDSVQYTPAARLTMERMIQMWTNFAKTGNPTPFLTDIVDVTWPIVNATGNETIHYLNISEDLVPEENPRETAMEFWDFLYNLYGYPPYNTY